MKTSSTNCLQLINIKRKEMNSQNDVHVFEIHVPTKLSPLSPKKWRELHILSWLTE